MEDYNSTIEDIGQAELKGLFKDFLKENPLVKERFLLYAWADQREALEEWLR